MNKCYWYDPNDTHATCSEGYGSALCNCPVNGCAEDCPWVNFGYRVGFVVTDEGNEIYYPVR